MMSQATHPQAQSRRQRPSSPRPQGKQVVIPKQVMVKQPAIHYLWMALTVLVANLCTALVLFICMWIYAQIVISNAKANMEQISQEWQQGIQEANQEFQADMDKLSVRR